MNGAASADRAAVAAMIQARSEGRDYLDRGEPDIRSAAARFSPSLRTALEVWKGIPFNFGSTNMPDAVVTPTS